MERDIVVKLCDPSYPPPPAGDMVLRLNAADEIERLRAAITTVVETFERDEAQGYRSKDRQFAVDILRKALAPALAARTD